MAQFVYTEVSVRITRGYTINMDELHPQLRSALESWFKAGYSLELFIAAQSEAVSLMYKKNGPREYRTTAGPGFESECPVCGIGFRNENDLMQHGFSNFGQTPHRFP